MDSEDLPPSINFPEQELKTLEFFESINAFETSCKLSTKRPRYTFYDGPPFATGLPHYGHILAGTIKDIVTRYAYSQGFQVERRFGWDCHGLPVEYEVDKENNITGPHDVEAMGLAAYNNKCRDIVMRYSELWRKTVQRIGRWIDFENDYRTMYPTFMESVWWVFKEIYEKGLVYRGVKVMPFSTACSTALSNFEAGQNYKDVQDPAVVVGFVLDSDPDTAFLAWTTTPWTLPSNLSLCVHPEKDYVLLHDIQRNRNFIMMEARLESVYKTDDSYNVLRKMKGRDLEGQHYKPLFDYFASMKKSHNAFRIVCDNYVTEESGTGIVHQAPYFGEDDLRVCLAAGIVTPDLEPVCPVDATGRFTLPVSDFAGVHVKDADKAICQMLKRNGTLISQSTVNHSYPFCWRSDTALIYKAMPTWFIRVEGMVSRLLANNSRIRWVPDFIGEKRFANWLQEARDWAISRNRYWGTPIPIWTSEDFEEVVCVGSIEELHRLSGVRLTDLHKEFVDQITIPSKMGKGDLRRISEVFDCWFESGSMPYAQLHYPFENVEKFAEGFPADFIAEGVDQTRGWFYTLLIISTVLFDQAPFKNLIVNGIILAADGQKMSKRAKNYPDPLDVINAHGADSLRLYLINSPVVRAQTLRFSEAGVRDVVKDVFIPWYSAFRYLMKSVVLPYERRSGRVLCVRTQDFPRTANFMDKWILSFTQSLIVFVRAELAAYRLYTVVPRLIKYIDHLVNGYIRMNRRRLKGDAGESIEEWYGAVHTLVKVHFQLICLMAPFTPLFTEYIYQRLRSRLDFSENPTDPENQLGIDPASGAPQSIHYILMAPAHEDQILRDVERTVECMDACLELGRSIRTKNNLVFKAPLREAVVIHCDEATRHSVTSMRPYLIQMLNVHQLTVTGDKKKYGVHLRGVLNSSVGARLKRDFKKVQEAVNALTDDILESYIQSPDLEVAGQRLRGEDLTIVYSLGREGEREDSKVRRGKRPQPEQISTPPAATDIIALAPARSYLAQADSNGFMLLLDTFVDDELIRERIAREIINRIQRTRKKANLQPEEAISIVLQTASTEIAHVLNTYGDLIDATVKQPISCITNAETCRQSISQQVICEPTEIAPDEVTIWIFRQCETDALHSTIEPPATTSLPETLQPPTTSEIVVQRRQCGSQIRVLTCNADGDQLVKTFPDLLRLVRSAFGWSFSAGLQLYRVGENGPLSIARTRLSDLLGQKLFAE